MSQEEHHMGSPPDNSPPGDSFVPVLVEKISPLLVEKVSPLLVEMILPLLVQEMTPVVVQRITPALVKEVTSELLAPLRTYRKLGHESAMTPTSITESCSSTRWAFRILNILYHCVPSESMNIFEPINKCIQTLVCHCAFLWLS